MKAVFIFIFLFISMSLAFGQDGSTLGTTYMHVMSNGIGIGSAIAVVASWSRNKSVLWAILHAIFGWIYVIYFVITGGSENK